MEEERRVDDRREDSRRVSAIGRSYLRFARQVRLILSILVVIQLAVGGAAIYLLIQNSNRTADIQSSRRENIVRGCLDENTRNNTAVLFLQSLPDNNRPPLPTKERQRLIQRFADALVGPVRKDCEAFADKALK